MGEVLGACWVIMLAVGEAPSVTSIDFEARVANLVSYCAERRPTTEAKRMIANFDGVGKGYRCNRWAVVQCPVLPDVEMGDD